MIYLVIDSYIKKVKPKYDRFLVLPIICLVLAIAFAFLAALNSLWFSIGLLLSLILFTILLSIQEKLKRNRISERYNVYNDTLNILVAILSSFTCLPSEHYKTWYNADRIKYLIRMCDLLVCESVHKTNKDFLKNGIIAVLSFGAGVITQKASLLINFQIFVIAVFLVIIIYCFNELIIMIRDFLFKSSSIEIILSLKYSLMDLLMRDFPDSAELSLEVEAIK